mmetsp:Transcript_91715/g.268430  ORF Transcript_91715/g.268430 Transcript_91715/m.268430 type:complete len:382 (+) Transcript_91715:172-1317(+)
MDNRFGLCIPLAAAVVGWLLTPQSAPWELGYFPPNVTRTNTSSWAGAPWPTPVGFSRKDRERFELEGFFVLRNYLPRDIVHRLHVTHDTWCKRGVFSPHWHCKNEDVWARTDIYRDFLYHSGLGYTVSQLLQSNGVRIYGDHITEMRANHSGIFYHFDNIYYGGVLGEFHAQSKGAIAFIFLTGVHPNVTGGSVLVQPGGHRDGCVLAGVDPSLQAPCREAFYKRAIAHAYNPGDILIIHPLMPHASQPPLPTAHPGLRRITYLARLVEADAVFCGTDTQVRETGKVDCSHGLRRGEKAHHVCYHQIYPVLPNEVAKRMSPDWYSTTVNVQRGWRYTRLKRLRLGLSDLVSRVRFRLNGGLPMALERAECIYSPEQLSMFG